MPKKLSKEDSIKRFNELVPKAAKVHQYTLCFQRQTMIPTESLKGEECVECSYFILNGGICDPL